MTGSEDCEPAQPLVASCTDFGFYGGDLACSQACRFETVNCAGRCGDGMVQTDAGEECDGGPPSSQCTAFGYDFGALKCSARCFADITGNCHRFGWRQLSSLPVTTFGRMTAIFLCPWIAITRCQSVKATSSRSLAVRAFSSSRAGAAYATEATFGWFDGNGAHTLDLPAELRARAVAVALNRNGKLALMEATCRLWEYDSLLAQWQMQQLLGSDAAPLSNCGGFVWSGD